MTKAEREALREILREQHAMAFADIKKNRERPEHISAELVIGLTLWLIAEELCGETVEEVERSEWLRKTERALEEGGGAVTIGKEEGKEMLGNALWLKGLAKRFPLLLGARIVQGCDVERDEEGRNTIVAGDWTIYSKERYQKQIAEVFDRVKSEESHVTKGE